MNRPQSTLTAKTLFAGVFACCLATTAGATTYYWKGTASTEPADYGLWTDFSNWSTESESGADTSATPGTSDTIYALGNSVWRKFDLDGGEYTIDGWSSTGDWNRHYWRFTNGSLHWTGSHSTHSDTVHLDSGATFVFDAGSTYHASVNHGAADEWKVHSGGSVSMLGTLQIYKLQAMIDDGGSVTFAPSRLSLDSSSQTSYLSNSGTLSIPNGISFYNGGSGATFELRQLAGTLELGGPISKNGKAGTYNVIFSGGTVAVANAVSFDVTSATVPANSSVTIDVAAGASIDLSTFTFGSGSAVRKTGAGDYLFANGDPLADNFVVAAGSLALESAGAYDISGVVFDSNGKVKIGAAGVTLTAWNNSLVNFGGFVADIASPVAGSTVLTCANASVLALAQTGFNATLPEGFAVRIDGNNLVVTSAYVFNSTTVTDLNDPAGWAGGSVPSNKIVTIMGAGVAPATTDLPPFARIKIQDGASLTIANGGTLPTTTLADDASLTISSGSATVGGALEFAASASHLAAVTVASGATLNVPGGTAFKNCALTLNGTLAATGDGQLIFGTAAAGETTHFSMTATGATITALNAAATENGSRLDFAVPASGGTVVVDAPIVLKNTTLTYNRKDGMAFGLNNPTSQTFKVIADNTPLNIGANTYVAGGANVVLTNGTVLLRKRHNAGDTNDSYYNIYVLNRGRITLVDGGEIRAGITRVNSNLTDGVIQVNPDEAGWVGIEVLNGGIGCWYKLDGRGKGTIRFAGGVMECFTTEWWSWGNRAHPFYNLAAVDIPAGKTMTFRGVSPKISENNSTMAGMEFEAPFTGGGNLVVENTRSGKTLEPTLYRADNTCTGRLSVSPDNGTAKAKLHFADGAAWPGTVVFSERTDFIPVDNNHSASAGNPATVSFGGVEMAAPVTFRVWISSADNGETFSITNDVVNVGATGWSWGEGVTVAFEVKSSYTFDDLSAGTEFVLGAMPKNGAVPASGNLKVILAEREIAGDNAKSLLVARVAANELVFDGAGGVTDLNDMSGWTCGYVPSGQDVMVRGTNVTALVNASQGLPSFSSITLREGATLKIVGKGNGDSAIALPALTIDAHSALEIGDSGQTETLAALPATLVTTALSAGADLSRITVQTNATLFVGNGLKFKNVDFRLYGTVTNELAEASPVFGYADSGETSYIAFAADGGVFGFHSIENAENASVSLLCPAPGGTVIPVGTMTLRNVSRTVTGWNDFGNWQFGVNNPTSVPFNVLADGTRIDCAAYLYVSGAARLSLVNGSRIRRADDCIGHYFEMFVNDSARIEVGDGCFVDLTTNDGFFKVENPTAVDAVIVRDKGAFTVSYGYSGSKTGHGVFVSDGGVLGVTKLGSRPRTDLLLGFGSARLDGDLTIQSMNIGTGHTDWNRHTKMANIPFTGMGDVVVTNGVPAYPFTVTMQNGASTATGAIRVNKVAGDAETALYFANGANWAGTVVAGDVALTNLADGAAAASVSFGALDLAADFPVRVWKENGVLTNDTVNVGQYGGNGGKLIPTLLTDGAEFANGDKVTVGTIAKTSPLPAVDRRWRCKLTDNGDDTNTLVLSFSRGLQIILR